MTWTADPAKREARNEHGYRIVWADNKHGTWYNGWSPHETYVHGNYDKEIVKARCEEHREKLEKQRQMRAAEKAAVEIG